MGVKCLRFMSKRKTVRVYAASMCGRHHISPSARHNLHELRHTYPLCLRVTDRDLAIGRGRETPLQTLNIEP
jgi:hypothetical protein